MEGAVENWSPKLLPDLIAQPQRVAAAWILCCIIADVLR